MDLEHEELAAAGQTPGQRHNVLDALLGQNGRPCGDPSDEGDRDGLALGHARQDGRRGGSAPFLRMGGNGLLVLRIGTGAGTVGQDDLEGARSVRVAPDQAEPLELVELMLDRRGARQTDRGADLPHGGRVPVRDDGVADGLVDGAGAGVERAEGRCRRDRGGGAGGFHDRAILPRPRPAQRPWRPGPGRRGCSWGSNWCRWPVVGLMRQAYGGMTSTSNMCSKMLWTLRRSAATVSNICSSNVCSRRFS